MKRYSKYILALVLLLLTYFLTEFILFPLSTSPNGTYYDIAYVKAGIKLILGVIIGCTTLIVYTINENGEK